jgi:S1-C subfamily serine protease
MRRALAATACLLWSASAALAQIPSDQNGRPDLSLPELAEPLSALLAMPALAPMMVLTASAAAVAQPPALPALSTAAQAGMIEESRKIFVELRFRLAPYDANTGIDKSRYWKRLEAWDMEEKAQDRATISLAASRAPGPGLLVAPLFDYDLQRLEAVVAVDADGREYPARPWGWPRRGNAVWFQADGLDSIPLPAWHDGKGLEHGYQARLSKDPFKDKERDKEELRIELDDWRSERVPMSMSERSFRRQKSGPGPEAPDEVSDKLFLLFDSSGSWRGWLADYAAHHPISPAALREQSLPWAEVQSRCLAAEARARRALPLVHLRFHPEAQDLFWGSSERDQELRIDERFDVGFPLAPRVLFSPRSLSAGLLRRLESVELLQEGKTRPARLVGVMRRGVAGYLVEPEAPISPLAAGQAPPDGETALSVEPYAVGPAMQVWSYPDRLEGTAAGYDGTLRRKPRFLAAAGGLLADLDGRPFGLMVEEIRQDSVVEADSWRKPSPLLRLHPLAELALAFAKPEEAVDARLKPPDSAGGKPRAWLGAQTQDISADLAKLLDVSGPTRGGRVGQLVNEVAPGSPAQRAGIKPGDVLLRLREAGKRQDALIPATGRLTSAPAANDAVEFFREPANGLADALAELAPGTSARLTFARGGRERTVEVALAPQPPDMESAPKISDPGTGLSLKELTPDVRRLLRLKDDFQGLLIYDVARGSPARVAGLRPFGLLVECAGQSVSSLAAFQSLLAERRGAGAAAVQVRSVYLGRPLYADLRITPEAAPAAP